MSPSDHTSSSDGIEWITDDFLASILKEKLSDTENIVIVKKEIDQASGKGENYLSILFRVKVQYKQKNSSESYDEHLIIKAFPESEFLQKIVHEMGVFSRELAIYHTVLPELYKFAQDQLNNGPYPIFSARCFSTSRNNTLVLEDLKHQGFRMADRKKRLDLNHCRLVIQNLAKLHGLSSTLHQKNSDIMNNYNDIMWCEANKDNLEKFIPAQFKSIAEKSKTWKGFETISSKLSRIEPNIMERFYVVTKLQPDGFHVLSHGDCWINNIMFKYSSEEYPTDLKFIDFQLTSIASPAIDLSYFLYSSPQNYVRELHIEELIHEYHTQLCQTMMDLGCNSQLLDFQELKDELRRTALFGLVTSILTLGVMLSHADDIPDLHTIKENDIPDGGMNIFEKTHGSKAFREAFEPLLIYFDKYGVLD